MQLTRLSLVALVGLVAHCYAACECDARDQPCIDSCVTEANSCVTGCKGDTACYESCIDDNWPSGDMFEQSGLSHSKPNINSDSDEEKDNKNKNKDGKDGGKDEKNDKNDNMSSSDNKNSPSMASPISVMTTPGAMASASSGPMSTMPASNTALASPAMASNNLMSKAPSVPLPVTLLVGALLLALIPQA
ncbi:hypothetical protein BC940DRAFT_371718 [Gongronella butleri]|nr:hypothetical protein BC940DRAFT_371718 [Gongronella butleri]